MILGEVRRMATRYPPDGWAQCSGQLVPINQNSALYSVIGTSFGGNGVTNFQLPDLPVDSGAPYYIAMIGIYPPWW